MKLTIVALLLLPILAFSDDRHAIAVRLNSLDALTRTVLPRAATRLGLDRLRVPDQTILSTRWKGYSVRATLRDIHASVPIDRAAPYRNQVRAKFAEDNRLEATLNAPDTRVTMRLSIEIESHHWYQPGLRGEFELQGRGLNAAGAVRLDLHDEAFRATQYALSNLTVDSVEIENLGLLGRIFDTVLRHTSMCGGTRSVNDCITRTVNVQLGRILTPNGFLKPLVDPMLSAISRSGAGIFSHSDSQVAARAALAGFRTEREAALLSWAVELTPRHADATCAAGLVASPRARDAAFDWNRRPSDDLEVALPLSLLENYLNLAARQGMLCFSGESRFADVRFGFSIAPVESISLATGEGELRLAIPVRAELFKLPETTAAIESHDLRATFEVALALENDPARGLCVRPHDPVLGSLEGNLHLSGIRLPLSSVRESLEDRLRDGLLPRLARMCFVRKTNPLGDMLALVLGDRTEAAPEHLWTSLSVTHHAMIKHRR